MEPLKESPDVKTKVIAILSVAREPITKGLLMRWLVNEWGVSGEDPEMNVQVEEALESPDVQQISEGNDVKYCLKPENEAAVAERLGDIQRDARMAITNAGQKRYGIKKLEP